MQRRQLINYFDLEMLLLVYDGNYQGYIEHMKFSRKVILIDLCLATVWLAIQYSVQPKLWNNGINLLQHWISYLYCIQLIIKLTPLLAFCQYFIMSPQEANMRFGKFIHAHFWIIESLVGVVLVIIITSDLLNILIRLCGGYDRF